MAATGASVGGALYSMRAPRHAPSCAGRQVTLFLHRLLEGSSLVTRALTHTSRPLQALVDLSAMTHNLAQARMRAGARPIWAVVKANAYGHGIENAVRAFAAADGLALLEIDEAQRARAAGWRKPILLLEGVFEARDFAQVAELDLTVVIHCHEQLAMLEHLAAQPPVSVYVKI